MDVPNDESFHQKAVHERLILEAAKDYAIFTTDLQRRITSWNAGAEAMFGYAEADISGQLADGLYVPEDRQQGVPAREVETAVTKGRAENERWHLRKGGSRVYGSGVVTPLRDETGTIVGVVKVMRDLTRQKQAEIALSQSEERFRAFVTATSDVVYRMSADWREMRQLVGKSFLPDTSTTSISWLEKYIPPPDQVQVRAAIEASIQSRKTFELEHRVIQADGNPGWTFSRAIPILDEQGEIAEWFGTASDITEYKRAEAALAASEAQYRTLFNSIDEGFCRVEVLFDEQQKSVDYRFLETNPAFIRQTGLENAIGKTMRELAPAHESFWFETYGRIAQTGKAVRFEHQASALDRFYDVYAFRIGESAANSVAILFNDITNRKRHEASLLLLNQVSQDLMHLTNIDETMNALGKKIGAYFGASVCAFSDVDQTAGTVTARYVWHRPDAIGPTGVYRLTEYHSEEAQQMMRIGRPEIVRNTASLPAEAAANLAALNVGAFVNTPLVREGQWRFTLSITDRHPREWRADELELMRELINRIWTRLERARAEEALARSERFVQGVVTSLPLVIYIFDLVERRNRYLSPQIIDLFGYTAPEMQDSGSELMRHFFHPDDRPRLAAYFERIRASGEDTDVPSGIFQIECRIRHRERGWVWVQCRDMVYQRDANGHPTLVLGTAEDITERRQTNESLLKSEKRFRLAIEAAELGTWEWDLLTNEVFWNEQHFRLFGMETLPQPIGPDVFLNHVHSNDRARVAALIQRAIAERSVYDTEFCALLDDGSERWLSGYGRIVEEQDGIASRMSGVMFDVNERRESEQTLRRSDERFRTLVQNLPDYAIFRIDPAGIITEWTEGAQRIKGYTAEEVVGQSIALFYTPEGIAANELRDEMTESAQHGRAERESVRIRKGGERFWVNEIMTAIHDGQGRLVGFTKISRDITQRRKADEDLFDSRQRLQIVLDSIADHAIITIDPQGRIMSWNPGAEQMFGYTADEAIGQSGTIIFTSEDRTTDQMKKEMDMARRQGHAPDERYHLHKNGTQFYVSGTQAPLYGADRTLLGYVKVARDLTDRRQMEHALREADQRKDEFLALLAHELRNPLATLSNTLLILQRTGGTHEAMTLPMATTLMGREVTHLVRLVDDLLDVSRISQGKIVLTKKRIDVVSVVRETAEAADGGFRAASRTLAVDLPTVPLYLSGDATRLKQVVSNLLNNALKFTPPGGHVWVSLRPGSQEPGGSMAVLRVRDDGIGIADHERERIFQMFVQVDSALGRTHDGLGLGLTLVSELVGLHGGRVTVQSEGEGRGSEFIVYLPAESETDEPDGTY